MSTSLQAGGRRWSRRFELSPLPIAVLLLFLLAACGSSEETAPDPGDTAVESEREAPPAEPDTEAPPAEPDTEAPPAGDVPQELVIALTGEHDDLAAGSGFSQDFGVVVQQVLEPLLVRDSQTNELVGYLALDWEIIDLTTVEFTLREGIEFHDGTALNAETAAEAFNWVWDADNGYLLLSQLGPSGQAFTATAVDDYVLRVEAALPDALLDQRVGWMTTFVSPTAIREMDRAELDENPVGTGPYKFVEWRRGEYILLEANDNWWGEAEGFGAVNFDTVRFLFRPEDGSRVAAVQAGEAHFAEKLPSDACLRAFGENCIVARTNQTIHMRPDHPSALLGDRRVREAIALAIDAETIGTELVGQGVQEAILMINPDSTGGKVDREPYGYDPERARELIAEAAAAGVPVQEEIWLAMLTGGFPNANEVGQAIQAQLQAVGFNVRFEALERGIWLDSVVSAYDDIPLDRRMVALGRHNNRLWDLGGSTPWFLCGGILTGYCNQELDRAMADASNLTGDERLAAMEELSEFLYDELVVIPLFHIPAFHGVAEELVWEPRQDEWLFVREMNWR